MSETQRDQRSGKLVTLMAVAWILTVPLFLLLGSQFLDIRENASSRCIHSDGANPDSRLLAADATVFPIGRRCEWLLGDRQTLVTQTGLLVTIVACAATACVLALTIYTARQPRFARPRAMYGPLIVSVAIWSVLIYVAASF